MADDRGLERGRRGQDAQPGQGREPLGARRGPLLRGGVPHRPRPRSTSRRPSIAPRASESIDLMVDLIATLIERGHAYVGGDGSVYFDARSFDGYGAISGNRLDALRPGHRFATRTAERRASASTPTGRCGSSPASTRTQLVWDTPWGVGLPRLAHRVLGHEPAPPRRPRIDVHTGGIDLRFPHHEDEKAQSDAAVGHEVVRHWVHAEHLLFEGRKMAKSTGNVLLLQDVIDRGHRSAGAAAVLPRAPLPAADEPHVERRRGGRPALLRPVADAGGRVGRVAVGPDATRPPAPPSSPPSTTTSTPRAPSRCCAGSRRTTPVPAGSRFETFAHLDRLLGLDLVREVGKPVAVAVLPEGAQEPARRTRGRSRRQGLGRCRPAARRARRRGRRGDRHQGRSGVDAQPA